MPELTDVERFKRYAETTSLHQVIAGVEVLSPELLENCTPEKIQSRLKGGSFTAAMRIGKHLLLKTSTNIYLTLHFGMTGFLLYGKHPKAENEHARMRIRFGNGYRLFFFCRRKLGKIGMASDIEKFAEDHGIGPDALQVSGKEFMEIFRGKRGMVKPALTNQKTLAGLGNILSDEILFSAGIHPREKIDDLAAKTLERLYKAMNSVLREGISRNPEKVPDKTLAAHRREGDRCPRCGGEIKLIRIQQRSSYYCAEHQKVT